MLLDEVLFDVPCPIFWKDLNSKFLGCNKSFLPITGFSDCNELIGKTDTDLPCKEFAEQYYEDDRYVIATGKKITRIEPIQLIDHLIISETTKTPLMQNGKIVGVLGVCIDITAIKENERLKIEIENQNTLLEEQNKFNCFVDEIQKTIKSYQLSQVNNQVNGVLSSNNAYCTEKISLTKRENEILYLLSLGKSPKEIANILSKTQNKPVCYSTINAMINKKLYPKFNVYNITQLVEKAHMMKKIPLLLDTINQT